MTREDVKRLPLFLRVLGYEHQRARAGWAFWVGFIVTFALSGFGGLMRIHETVNCMSPTGWARDEVCGPNTPVVTAEVWGYYILNGLGILTGLITMLYGIVWLFMKITSTKELK